MPSHYFVVWGKALLAKDGSFSGAFSRQPSAGDNDIDRRGLPPIGLPIALWRSLTGLSLLGQLTVRQGA
jgi:hypothetical protein